MRSLHGNTPKLLCASINIGAFRSKSVTVTSLTQYSLLLLQETHVMEGDVKMVTGQCRAAGWQCHFAPPSPEPRKAGLAILWRSPMRAQVLFHRQGRLQAVLVDTHPHPFVVCNFYGYVNDGEENEPLHDLLRTELATYWRYPMVIAGDWNAEDGHYFASELYQAGWKRLHPAVLPTCFTAGGQPTAIDHALASPTLASQISMAEVKSDDTRFYPHVPLCWRMQLAPSSLPTLSRVPKCLSDIPVQGPRVNAAFVEKSHTRLTLDEQWELIVGHIDPCNGYTIEVTARRLRAHLPTVAETPLPPDKQHKHFTYLTTACHL
eukprot:1152919-Amphidinium_carterae.2